MLRLVGLLALGPFSATIHHPLPHSTMASKFNLSGLDVGALEWNPSGSSAPAQAAESKARTAPEEEEDDAENQKDIEKALRRAEIEAFLDAEGG